MASSCVPMVALTADLNYGEPEALKYPPRFIFTAEFTHKPCPTLTMSIVFLAEAELAACSLIFKPPVLLRAAAFSHTPV